MYFLLKEFVIDCGNGAIQVVSVDADDNIDLAATLVDHFDIDIGVGQGGKDARGRTGLITHSVSDDGDQGDIFIDENNVRIDFAADLFDNAEFETVRQVIVRHDKTHRVDTRGHMFDADIVILENRQDLAAKTDFVIHKCFPYEEGGKTRSAGDTGNERGLFIRGIVEYVRSNGGRIKSVAYIDRDIGRL